MQPGERITLENIEDARVAEAAALAYHRLLLKDGIINIRMANQSTEFPLELSRNRTEEIRKGLGVIAITENGFDGTSPAVAANWLERIHGPAVPELPDGTVIVITDSRKRRAPRHDVDNSVA